MRVDLWIKKGLTPERINIQTGVSDDSYTEIKSNVLKEGDRVIISKRGKSTTAQNKRGVRPPRL